MQSPHGSRQNATLNPPNSQFTTRRQNRAGIIAVILADSTINRLPSAPKHQIMKFHHIGVATSNLEPSIKAYQLIGYSLQNDAIFEDPIQKVNLCFMYREGSPLIELVAPGAVNSPVSAILAKNGSTPYHTCYEVDDLEQAIAQLKSSRFISLGKPVPAIAFGNRFICFMLNKDIGLVELLQAHR